MPPRVDAVWRRRLLRLVTVVVLSTVASIGVVEAQIGTGEGFIGAVKDSSGGALPGATITATNIATGFTQTATTDGAGAFHLVSLPLGDYTVEASLQGFRPELKKGLVLTVARTLEVTFTLQIDEISEKITSSSRKNGHGVTETVSKFPL